MSFPMTVSHVKARAYLFLEIQTVFIYPDEMTDPFVNFSAGLTGDEIQAK